VRAAVLEAYGAPLRIADLRVSDPADDEVRIRTVASSVCHTDRTAQLGAWDMPLPLVLGHEAAGVVEAVGARVSSAAPGDHVVTCAHAFCGVCEWCMRGMPHQCANRGVTARRRADQAPRLSLDGVAADAYAGLGGFASELLVHERAVVKIPREMPFDRAALLGCAVVTGIGAIRYRAQLDVGDTVAVIGCGGVGLNVVQGARIMGASRIIAIDRDPHKLAVAIQKKLKKLK